MKRFSAVVCLAMMLVMVSTVISFGAEDFKIASTYPKDGAKNTTKENMCVKVMFNTPVGNAASKKANKNKFYIRDKSGRKYPSRIYYNKKNTKYALILVDTTKVPVTGKRAIKDNKEYTCVISKDFINNDGTKLGDDSNRVINFRTMNQSRNTTIYMVMMFLMFGGMFAFAGLQSRKEKNDDAKAEEEVFNPYREAKKSGRPVAEVIAEHEKEEEKRKERHRRKREKEEEIDQYVREMDEHRFRVKGPRPVSAGGSSYKTGRKAAAEAEAKKREAEKAARKASGYQKKKHPQKQQNNGNKKKKKR